MCDLLFDRVPVFYLERVINGIFPGLQMHARDVDLTPEQASWYVPGEVICERGFTDATSRFMGMVTSHRITILSNHMANLSQFSDDPEVREWELCVAQHGSHFKVMDVYEIDGKTQILLLHLPDDENWRIFEQVVVSMEESIVAMARERFEAKCEADVVGVLATRRWLDRVSWPVGFMDDGEPQPLSIPVEDRLRPLGEVGFRAIAGNVVLLAGMVERLKKRDSDAPFADGFPDLLAYGYVDSQAGLCAHALTSARVEGEHIVWAHDFDDTELTVRLGGFEGTPVAQVVDGSLSEFSDRITLVEENDSPAEELAQLRGMRFMDRLRNPTSPDDILVTLLTKTKRDYSEEVWVRLRHMENDMILGELLIEPHQGLGVHAGAVLPVSFADTDEGPRAFVIVDELTGEDGGL